MRSKQSGSIMIVSMVIVFVAVALVGAFLFPSVAKHRAMETEFTRSRAKFMALSAITHAMDELNDFQDGNVGTLSAPISLGPGTYYASTVDHGDDTYTITGSGAHPGKHGPITVVVTCVVQRQYSSIYENGLIGGKGSSGMVINGNAGVAGGVFIFGENPDGSGDAGPTDVVISFSGTGGVRDDYSTMPASLVAKVPGITPQYPLKTEVRVKNGQVDLSGSGTLGTSGNPIDGWYGGNVGGTAGTSNLYSNNGTSNGYDVPDAFTFPAPGEPYKGYPDYEAYVAAQGMDMDAKLAAQGTSLSALRTGAGASNENRIDDDTPAFSAFDGGSYETSTNGIRWTPGTGLLEVKGVIRTGGSLVLGKLGGADINYDGKATIWVDSSGGGSGYIDIHSNILSQGIFPTEDVLGLVAKDDINVATGPGDAQLDFTLLMYAGNTFTAGKQADIAGTVFANYFDLGTNVPAIFAVPQLKDNLPPGWIFDGKVPGKVARVAWKGKP